MKDLFFIAVICFVFYLAFPIQYSSYREISSRAESISGAACGESLLAIDSATNKTAIEAAFTQCLSDYIKIRTISPKGYEHLAVEFFEDVFSKLDIPTRRFYGPDLSPEKQPERVNLIATLSADKGQDYDWSKRSKKRSVLMLNHMDVVDVIADQWEEPELAWSGKVAPDKSGEMYIWGRGALDMKGIAITQLINMWLLKVSDFPLKRDLHFMSVADEESGGSGAIASLKLSQKGNELYALRNVDLILNEGGGAVRDTPKEGHNLILISSEEKGGAWMRFKHRNISKLLSDLYQSKMADLNKYLSRKAPKFTGHDCQIETIETPKAKVNVVASLVNLTLKCREGFQTEYLFRNIFEKKFKTVKADIRQNGVMTKLTLETSSASHGSTGINESAIEAMMVGLYHLGLFDLKYKKKNPRYLRYMLTPATRSMIKGLGEAETIVNIIRHLNFIPFIRTLILKEVENSFGLDGLFRTNCQVSAINYQNNQATSLVDCRLLHTAKGVAYGKSHAESFIKEIKNKLNDNQIEIELISGWDVSQSPVHSHDFNLIVKALRSDPKVIAVPYMFPAGTDSTWYRNPYSAGAPEIKPIPAYGFFPLYMSEELLASYHGSNERFPIKEINPTIETYGKVLKKLVKSPGGNIIKRAVNRLVELKERNPIESDSPASPGLSEEVIEYYHGEVEVSQ